MRIICDKCGSDLVESTPHIKIKIRSLINYILGNHQEELFNRNEIRILKCKKCGNEILITPKS